MLVDTLNQVVRQAIRISQVVDNLLEEYDITLSFVEILQELFHLLNYELGLVVH